MFKDKQKEKEYFKNYYQKTKIPCTKCNKLISYKAKSGLCKKCCRLEKLHHGYKNGKRCRYKKHYCTKCKKRILCISKLCKSCARIGKNNSMYKMDKNTIIKHHIYLRENGSRILKLSRSKHAKLHNRAYEYIYNAYGKRGILNYIQWFNKKYGLK